MVARIAVLEIPSQAPLRGVVRPRDSTGRSWFKVSRFCYSLMMYSCDRRLLPRYRHHNPIVIQERILFILGEDDWPWLERITR